MDSKHFGFGISDCGFREFEVEVALHKIRNPKSEFVPSYLFENWNRFLAPF